MYCPYQMSMSNMEDSEYTKIPLSSTKLFLSAPSLGLKHSIWASNESADHIDRMLAYIHSCQ